MATVDVAINEGIITFFPYSSLTNPRLHVFLPILDKKNVILKIDFNKKWDELGAL